MTSVCTECRNSLTPYEQHTILGREGLCADCATTNMIMGGMSPRLASLYYENGHDDAVGDQVLCDKASQ